MAQTIYDIDLTNFYRLDEEACYWLGFIAADGCVFDYGNGNVGFTLSLNEKDKEHIEKFQRFNTMDNMYKSFYKERTRKNVLSEEKIKAIIYDLLTLNVPMTHVANMHHVCYATIKAINNGKNHHKNYLFYPLRKNIQANLENL